jgi:DNA end-binding protein Ku
LRLRLIANFQLAAAQKEMLMPIAGKKPAKEAAAKKPAARRRNSA